MEIENRLSIVSKHLDSAIMEITGTYQRDKLLEALLLVKQIIWGIKKDKIYDKEHPNWKKQSICEYSEKVLGK